MTPEGRIKSLIKKYLFTLHSLHSPVDLYYEMPVPTGFGKSGLDFTCCINGRFVAIEAKAPHEWLTPRQRKTSLNILRAGGKVFVISGPEGLDALKRWVVSVAYADTLCQSRPSNQSADATRSSTPA